jgi:hypothetical protein
MAGMSGMPSHLGQKIWSSPNRVHSGKPVRKSPMGPTPRLNRRERTSMNEKSPAEAGLQGETMWAHESGKPRHGIITTRAIYREYVETRTVADSN